MSFYIFYKDFLLKKTILKFLKIYLKNFYEDFRKKDPIFKCFIKLSYLLINFKYLN